MLERKVEVFKDGQVTTDKIDSKNVPRGAARDSLNFITKGDKIEISRGSKILGTEVTGSGRVSGLPSLHLRSS